MRSGTDAVTAYTVGRRQQERKLRDYGEILIFYILWGLQLRIVLKCLGIHFKFILDTPIVCDNNLKREHSLLEFYVDMNTFDARWLQFNYSADE